MCRGKDRFRKEVELYFGYLDSCLDSKPWNPFEKDFRKDYHRQNGVYLISELGEDEGMRYIGKSYQNLEKNPGLYDRLGGHWKSIERGWSPRNDSTRKLFREGKGANRYWVKCLTNSDGILEGMEEGYETHLIKRFRLCNLINQ